MKRLFIVMALSGLMVRCGSSDSVEFTGLSGPYFGLTPPGKVAERFNPPGIFFEDESEGCSCFLNDGTVYVFTSMKDGGDWRLRPTYVTELKNGRWTVPVVAPFSQYGPYNLSSGPDGQTIWFTTMKSPDKTISQWGESSNIWAVKLERNGWAEPVMMGRSINTDNYAENYPTVTREGTVYYMSRRQEGEGGTDVWMSRNLDGYYGEAENVGPPVNTAGGDADPFVAPDDSYLIICQNKDEGFGKYDLYVYFHKEDGTWTEGFNLGELVNSEEYEFRPCVTPDGKYLFFTSNRAGEKNRGHVYWVDTSVIDDLKPDDL